MTRYEELQQQLLKSPQTWLITGVAGFIGSNLLEALLKLNQSVVGLGNFVTFKVLYTRGSVEPFSKKKRKLRV